MKSLMLFLYATALFFIVRYWYQKGNTGIPGPQILAPPTYLYGGLSIASGFTGDLTIPLALGMTVALVLQAKGQTQTGQIIPLPQRTPQPGAASAQ